MVRSRKRQFTGMVVPETIAGSRKPQRVFGLFPKSARTQYAEGEENPYEKEAIIVSNLSAANLGCWM